MLPEKEGGSQEVSQEPFAFAAAAPKFFPSPWMSFGDKGSSCACGEAAPAFSQLAPQKSGEWGTAGVQSPRVGTQKPECQSWDLWIIPGLLQIQAAAGTGKLLGPAGPQLSSLQRGVRACHSFFGMLPASISAGKEQR